MSEKKFKLAVRDEDVFVWEHPDPNIWKWSISDNTNQLDETQRRDYEFSERKAKSAAANMYRYCLFAKTYSTKSKR